MAIPLRMFEVELEQPVEECSVLEGQVAHIERDVTELKVDVRRIDTKVDAIGGNLAAHRAETERSFGTLRAEMQKSDGVLRADLEKSNGTLRAEILKVDGGIRSDMEKGFGKLRADMEKGFGEVRAEIAKVDGNIRSDMEKGFGMVRAEIKDIKVWMLTWAIATTIAALTLSFNVARFLQAPIAATLPATAPPHAAP